MAKVIYNGKEIELRDELEKGELELDLNINDINLENTLELIFNEEGELDNE